MQSVFEQFSGKRAHFIGIGGSSMSGLAKLFLQLGVQVSGSDASASHKTEELEAQGIKIFIGQQRGQVVGADLVVYSAAISPDNPERAEAAELGIASLERSELLGLIASAFPTPICISGTHGKTTTTAMVSQVLLEAGADPSVHIGGSLPILGGSTRLGRSGYFVVEACEYARSFHKLYPKVALILNIDEDHLDCYGDIEHIEEAFAQFAAQTTAGGWVIGCGDDMRVRRVLENCGRQTRTYGLQPHNEITAEQISYDETGCASFTATLFGHPLCDVELRIPGEHSLLNALASIAVADLCQLPMSRVAETLARFENPKRRFELTGITDGVRLYTDYSHNPAEMRNAIHNAHSQPHETLWAVWQPHTFSRTKDLYDEFLGCFGEADRVVITDIMAAREQPDPTLNSGMLVRDLRARGIRAEWAPGFDDAEALLRANWKSGDVVITMGCGNIDLLNEQIENHGDTR
ncbi:MAG: UDP-N-acetylmuramate--L-alanine ligase [Eubacteriales bacterium]|nr:UDP-N-acetylmuramate--L-alanine ligase [Eubacteriales bacterium]